ncbi:DUF6460 domain-containing protein [Hyphococcus sp.]|jgi:hypothetical protein|uniref:DUF6460 domain-containing protein n=1 Tax=Hyphococcus sp. TaxID=2038636 RepID=UPI003D13713F
MSGPSIKDRRSSGKAGGTAIKLIFASLIVGAVFSFLGIGVREFWSGIFDNVRDVIGALGENIGEIALTLLTYLVIGAGIVIPIWLIARLLSNRK